MPPLPDVVVEEIFLRLPPDEPACLVRASVANKLWLGELTGARFRGRYLDFHGAPPMLGFLYYRSRDTETVPQPDMLSTTGFRARLPPDGWGGRRYAARDCRHGRVLLEDSSQPKRPPELAVWDPMTGRRTGLVAPGEFWSHRAAVLCAVDGCDHRACRCHDGPFRVVLVGVDRGVARAYVSSPETGEWSEPCPGLDLDSDMATIEPMPAVLVRDALHFLFTYFGDDTVRILRYDLRSARLSMFDAPAAPALVDDSILVAMRDGSLGFACLNYTVKLRLWSRQNESWTQRRVVDVKSLLPAKDPNKFTVIRPTLIGSVEGSDIVFVTTDMGIFEINFTSLQCKKLWKPEVFTALIPYMSFYSPQGKSMFAEKVSRL